MPCVSAMQLRAPALSCCTSDVVPLSASPPRMNARHQEYRLSLEIRQVNDAVSCIFHSLLTHRSVAKFQYKDDSNYSLGSLGTKEVECENIDLSYIKINSDELSYQLEKEIQPFLAELDHTVKAAVPRRHTPHCSPTSMESAIPLLGAQISLEFFQRRPRPWPLPVESVAWERWILFLDIFKASSYDCQPYLFKVCRVPIRPETVPQTGFTGMRRYLRDLVIN